ncbi:uncharacterized protein LOC118444421 [Vespa mandarinia]|uniref:uncharacterized protein LOC118444421 n=1 Tax=Vespa mandarinia TaxID=7446 RepID=UPI00161980B6|nr:uncharacterized protein LOC118444421 [Vespa mandarinia]
MQPMIVLLAILSVASCSQLTLVPYAYLADPLPVYHQSQNTRTGEHAYSYSGGPSAKEEVKGPDGVTRGSYSYVDAHGILQSVFYVADEGGFRVAATNLPTDSDLPVETAEVLLAKRALFEEQARATSSEQSSSARRKRSLTEETKKEHREEDSKSNKQEDYSNDKPYGALATFLLPGSLATATSHQSQVRIHQDVRTEGVDPIANAVTVEAATPVLPLIDPIKSEVIKTPLIISDGSVALLTDNDYHQNRIKIHRNLGLEGEEGRKDAVKIETPVLAEVRPLVSEPVAILEHRPSLLTAVSSQSVTQIHLSDKHEIPSIYELPALYHAIPIARSSQYRTQIHSSQRIESADDSENLREDINKEKSQDEAIGSSLTVNRLSRSLLYAFQTILFSVLLGSSLSSPIANVWVSPIGSISPLRQYHVQDGSGSYRYSFTGPHHAKTESNLNGITQGGYSYIDANGILQTVSYTADDQNGFRVSASNLPEAPKNEHDQIEDTPEVAAAKRNHLEELQKSQLADRPNWNDQNILSYKILPPYVSYAQLQPSESKIVEREIQSTKNPFLLSQAEADNIQVPKPDPTLSQASPSSLNVRDTSAKDEAQSESDNPNALEIGKFLQMPNVHRTVALPAPYVFPVLPYRLLHSSLHHTQDSLGQYDYSYTGDSSAKTESRSLDGTTRGAYSYIDPNGILQQVHYVADHNGFRVLATNLPEAK